MKVLGSPTLKITPGISLDSSSGKGVTRSCISTPYQMGPWSYLSPDSWCGLTSCLLNISLTVTNSLVLFMRFTVINWDQLQKVWSIPANFSHVKCDWFSYPCLTEFLKQPDSFGTVPKTLRRLPNITEDVPMIFEGHRMQRLEASNLGGHLAEITYILIPRGGIVRR